MSELGKCDVCGRDNVQVARTFPAGALDDDCDEFIDQCALCAQGIDHAKNTVILTLWEFMNGEHFSRVEQLGNRSPLNGTVLQGETHYTRTIGSIDVHISVDPNWCDDDHGLEPPVRYD